jgi:hypothetical protein
MKIEITGLCAMHTQLAIGSWLNAVLGILLYALLMHTAGYQVRALIYQWVRLKITQTYQKVLKTKFTADFRAEKSQEGLRRKKKKMTGAIRLNSGQGF